MKWTVNGNNKCFGHTECDAIIMDKANIIAKPELTAKSTEAQLKAIPLIKALFCEVNPIPVKAAMNMLGYNVGIPRLPLIEMSDSGKEKMKKALKDFGL